MPEMYYVYLLASRRNGTLYIGVTNNLMRRIWEHREKIIPGFSEAYKVSNLVYFETTPSIQSAIAREKQLKKWNRAWKIRLIEEENKNWEDLYEKILSSGSPGQARG